LTALINTKVLKRVLGDPQAATIKRLRRRAKLVEALAGEYKKLTDTKLKAKTQEFKDRLAKGEKLDALLPEAFAAVREAATRTLGQRHFEVQLVGGMVLHEGNVAEMKTGEGKTLVATLPVYLNALEGQGVHVVTVNDYLAQRDAGWMGQVYDFLGMTTGVIIPDESYVYDPAYENNEHFDARLKHLRPSSRQDAYAADIPYGTNNEFGFDYLRDNMVPTLDRMVQRDLAYAIVDEVDNILIDEARTPLIISGQAEQATDRYYQFAQIVKQLREGRDYEVDLKHKTVALTEPGIDRVEELLELQPGESIYDERYIELTHYLEQALKAHATFQRDKDYIVRDGEVIIVDEFTGRMMLGRRYSEGLHQAIEAKEGVRVRRQNVTLATITFQNYFRMYDKLAGMTGTAKTEAEEFRRIYFLDVVVIPTNQPMVRDDLGDLVFKNERGKFRAVISDIKEKRESGRPVLVGTASIEASERLSEQLLREGVPHQVLNAKQHEREAAIIAEAGQPQTVTIATNMAGRGTDIVLGPGVREAGGLHILGTERHEARRIDNQLRGRAGRQGDPGSSRFYVSLEDELMRLFGSERISTLMERLGMEEDVPIEHGVISKSIENAQIKVEGHNFDLRKHVVQYDDIMNKHREVIYADRRQLVMGEDIQDRVWEMVEREIEKIVDANIGDGRDLERFDDAILEAYTGLVPMTTVTLEEIAALEKDDLIDMLIADAAQGYEQVETRFTPEVMRKVERHVMLTIIDKLWVEHLTAMDELREGVGLQAYAQKDPLVVYKTQGYEYFQQLLASIQHDVVHTIFRVQPVVAQQPVRTRVTDESDKSQVAEDGGGNGASPRKSRKIGVNEPCPCGSGKKYKHCHGARTKVLG
jgi:preprotein translocase subunit SecA